MNEKIEMETVSEENPFNQISGDFIKLERDKAKLLVLCNWKIQKIKKFKDDKGELKEQPEFSADVLSEDGQPVTKVFTTTSYNAMKGLKEIFSKYWPDTTTPRKIRIKKIGEGKATIYDIEEHKL